MQRFESKNIFALTFKVGFSGPKTFPGFRETGPNWSVSIDKNCQRFCVVRVAFVFKRQTFNSLAFPKETKLSLKDFCEKNSERKILTRKKLRTYVNCKNNSLVLQSYITCLLFVGTLRT